MYSMFTESFFIEKELENVKSQIDGLHDATDTYLDFGFNKIALMFTIVGAVLGIAALINLPELPWLMPVIGAVFSGIAMVVVLAVYRRRRKK